MQASKLTLAVALAMASSIQAGYAATPLTNVPHAVTKIPGISAPNVLSPELMEVAVAQGSTPLENPAAGFASHYGYNDNGPMVPAPNAIQSPGSNVEASKTEPDKNAYLVLNGQNGADSAYDYGTHFLFQGHETGLHGYITRINLDADGDHRVTLMASQDVNGANLPTFDGITWNPFTKTLLLTAENGNQGGVWQATAGFPSRVTDISGVMGRGGYEGIQTDSDGNVWIVEDSGGAKGTVNNYARQPNSFIYRLVPNDKRDLSKGGKLQALQVMSLATQGQAIVFHAGQADADIMSQDIKDLHTYGKVFTTNWVTIHDTSVQGFSPFDANAAAKAAGATPFKRPENAQFRPGKGFREFYFDATGDTDSRTQAGSEYGGFGAVFKLTQRSPSDTTGSLSLFYRGDVQHSGFDNVAFWSKDEIVFVEDAGDTLHTQRNAFDSAYMFNVNMDYSAPGAAPTRILALGRDPSATIDSGYSGLGNGFQNEGDNEITGIHVSDGDASPLGLLGAKLPHLFNGGWRAFYTQQHGDNMTWEILSNETAGK